MNYQEPNITHLLDADSRALRVKVPGDVLSTNADRLRESLFELVNASTGDANSPWETLSLDLSAAQMVDSVGLNLIVALLRALRIQGRNLQVQVSSAHVHRSFVFTRLDRQLELLRN